TEYNFVVQPRPRERLSATLRRPPASAQPAASRRSHPSGLLRSRCHSGSGSGSLRRSLRRFQPRRRPSRALRLPTIACVACRDPAPSHHVGIRRRIVLCFRALVSVVIVTVARTLLRGQVVFKVVVVRLGNFQCRLVCSVHHFVGVNQVLASLSFAPPL